MKSNRENSPIVESQDYSHIPDGCLAGIFQFLRSNDRKNCSLVCRRWFDVEAQSRRRLTLTPIADVIPHVPAIFSRFDSVRELRLRSYRRSPRISDEALAVISLRCENLTRLKIRRCHGVSGVGLAALARNCKSLMKFSCEVCTFGSRGMIAFLDHCSSLEKLSVKFLCGTNDGGNPDPVGPGAAASSLKSISLKDLYRGDRFAPLITASKNLKTLKISRIFGDLDRFLETIARGNNNLQLETLHLAMNPGSTLGMVDKGLIAIAKNSANLKELVLDSLMPTITSLSAIASNCLKLERLTLSRSETIGDPEVSCIARKCVALKKLFISECEVSDEGIQAFASGCPNLVKLEIKNCKHVTGEVTDWLMVRRQSLSVNLVVEQDENQTASE